MADKEYEDISLDEEDEKGALSADHWRKELKIAKTYFEKRFLPDAEQAVRAYFAEDRKDLWESDDRKAQVFWSNIQTLEPAAYQQPPKADIRRRFGKDAIGRLSAQILEQATDSAIDQYDFDYMAKQVVHDRLVPGRGIARIFYNATFEDAVEKIALTARKGKLYDHDGQAFSGPNDAVKQRDEGFYYETPYKRKTYETVECRYVQYKDFRHNKARSWDEVRWVGFRSYLTRDELVAQYGTKKVGANAHELHFSVNGAEELDDYDEIVDQKRYQKAEVWEIWNKPDRKVYHVAYGKGKNIVLKVVSDPLGLKGFFPCPRPLQATTKSGDFLPRADYAFYRDQCEVINDLTRRRADIIDAIRVVAVCDKGDHAELQYIFSESASGPTVIPVKNWVPLQKKGGIQGALEFLPLDVLVQALAEIDKALAIEFQRLYEIAGIPDIMRGNTDPLETARAQKIKAQYSERRVDTLKRDVARYMRDVVALIAEVIAEQFSAETIYLLAGVEALGVDNQAFDAAIALLRDDVTRNYRLDIETDSTVALDEAQEKQDAQEYLAAVTPFFEKTAAVMQQSPALGPAMAETLKGVNRAYKWGRTLEETLETAIAQVQSDAQAARNTPPPPDPAIMKIQMESQAKQAQMQMEAQIEQAKQQMEFQFRDRELRTKELEAQAKVAREQYESSAQVEKMRGELTATIEKLQADITKMRVELAGKGQELRLKEAELELNRTKVLADIELKRAEVEAKGGDVDEGALAGRRQPKRKIARIVRDAMGNMVGAEIDEIRGGALNG